MESLERWTARMAPLDFEYNRLVANAAIGPRRKAAAIVLKWEKRASPCAQSTTREPRFHLGDHLQHPGHREQDEADARGAEEQVVATLTTDQESGQVARCQEQVPAHERNEEEAEPHRAVCRAAK